MATHDTTALLAQVRRIARAPSATAATGWSDADLLAHANDVLDMLAAQLLAQRKDYLTAHVDIPFVAGVTSYRLPSRALLGRIRDVKLIDAGGETYPFGFGSIGLSGQQGTDNASPRWWYVEGSKLVVTPPPDAGTYTKIRVWYPRRPNALVSVADCLTVTSIAGGNTIFNGTKPSGITTSTPCDIIQGAPPHDWLATDVTPSSVSAGDVTFSTAPTVEGVPGDYVCLAGQSPIAQLPEEWYALLVRQTALSLVSPASSVDLYTAIERQVKAAEEAIAAGMVGERTQTPSRVVNTTWA